MKKKTLIIIAVLMGIFIAGIAIGLISASVHGLGISTGVCLITDNGSLMLISHGSPIKLNDPDYNNDFTERFSDGDKILSVHSLINESYPASTFSYFEIRLSHGKYEDIPEETISQLTELGWLGTGDKTVNTAKKVSIEKACCNFSADLPEGWTYKEIIASGETDSFSLELYKEDSPEDKLVIECRDSFGVCGTGLHTQEITLSGYNAHKGIYDDNPSWNYILFEDTPGIYVIFNHISQEKMPSYNSDVNAILDSAVIAHGIISYDEALSIAKANATGEYKKSYGEFSLSEGIWSFSFDNSETSQTIRIDMNGELV